MHLILALNIGPLKTSTLFFCCLATAAIFNRTCLIKYPQSVIWHLNIRVCLNQLSIRAVCSLPQGVSLLKSFQDTKMHKEISSNELVTKQTILQYLFPCDYMHTIIYYCTEEIRVVRFSALFISS